MNAAKVVHTAAPPPPQEHTSNIFPSSVRRVTGISYPMTYDTPARRLLGALNASLSKHIAADGEVMSA